MPDLRLQNDGSKTNGLRHGEYFLYNLPLGINATMMILLIQLIAH